MESSASAGDLADADHYTDDELDTLARVAYRIALPILRDHGEAENVAQLTMATLIVRDERPRNPAAWVTKVAKNFALKAVRRLVRMRPEEGIDLREHREHDEDEAERIAARLLVDEVLGQLPPRQREALDRRYLQDRPLASVADQMGVSEETAKTHVKRGLASARAILVVPPDEDEL